jgi:predicted dinucleotide-binding enzyme
MRKVGVLGSGVVGQTLAGGFKRHGYEVRIGSRTPAKLERFSQTSGVPAGTFAEVAAWGELLVLAVQGVAASEVIRLAGLTHLAGKTVIDTTNPLSEAPPVDGVLQLFTGPNSSLMEELQRTCPDARFVKHSAVSATPGW